MQLPSILMPLTEVLLGLPLKGGWIAAPFSLQAALTEMLDAGSPLVEEHVEDDGTNNFNWLVRLSEQGIAARVRIEARWAMAADRDSMIERLPPAPVPVELWSELPL